MVPDIIAWGVPFVSGAAGIVLGLKVGIVRLEERYSHVHSKVEENKAKLEKQVGDKLCKEYRDQCQSGICHSLDVIFTKLDKIETNIVNLAVQVAKVERTAE